MARGDRVRLGEEIAVVGVLAQAAVEIDGLSVLPLIPAQDEERLVFAKAAVDLRHARYQAVAAPASQLGDDGAHQAAGLEQTHRMTFVK